VGKPEGSRPLRIPRLRWEYNIKMNLQDVGCRSMDWIELARQGQVVGTCECSNEETFGFHTMRGIS
jgi:hypothetical protein